MEIQLLHWHFILLILSAFVSFAFQVNEEYVAGEMLCRKCGHGVTMVNDLINVPTSKAIRQRNYTVSSNKKMALIQLLENPQGNKFEVITAMKADGLTIGDKTSEHSWFPGFAWTIFVCPHCGFYLGWKFHAADESNLDINNGFSFFGLILSHLIGSTYADSLIITPRAYQS